MLPRYERIAFEKSLVSQPGQPLAAFVCPGHPLRDAVIDLTLKRPRRPAEAGRRAGRRARRRHRAPCPVPWGLVDAMGGRARTGRGVAGGHAGVRRARARHRDEDRAPPRLRVDRPRARGMLFRTRDLAGSSSHADDQPRCADTSRSSASSLRGGRLTVDRLPMPGRGGSGLRSRSQGRGHRGTYLRARPARGHRLGPTPVEPPHLLAALELLLLGPGSSRTCRPRASSAALAARSTSSRAVAEAHRPRLLVESLDARRRRPRRRHRPTGGQATSARRIPAMKGSRRGHPCRYPTARSASPV